MHPIRTCIGCGSRDDHPHHQVVLADGNSAFWHFDCHVLVAECDHCEAQLEGVGGVEGNPKGEELRAHLNTTGPAPDQPGWTDPSYVTEG